MLMRVRNGDIPACSRLGSVVSGHLNNYFSDIWIDVNKYVPILWNSTNIRIVMWYHVTQNMARGAQKSRVCLKGLKSMHTALAGQGLGSAIKFVPCLALYNFRKAQSKKMLGWERWRNVAIWRDWKLSGKHVTLTRGWANVGTTWVSSARESMLYWHLWHQSE